MPSPRETANGFHDEYRFLSNIYPARIEHMSIAYPTGQDKANATLALLPAYCDRTSIALISGRPMRGKNLMLTTPLVTVSVKSGGSNVTLQLLTLRLGSNQLVQFGTTSRPPRGCFGKSSGTATRSNGCCWISTGRSPCRRSC